MEKNTFWKVMGIGGMITNTIILAVIAYKTFGTTPPPPMLHHPPNEHPMGKELDKGIRPEQRIIRALGFDKEQASEYRSLIQDDRKTVRALLEKEHQFRKSLFTSEHEENIHILLDSIAVNRKNIERQRLEHFQKVESICNKEQKERFKRLKPQILKWMKPKKRPHRPHPNAHNRPMHPPH